MNGILFVSEDIEFQLVDENNYKKWLLQVAQEENCKIGEILYSFVSKDSILKINHDYLKHNYFTDIITFNDSFLRVLKGKVIICIDMVKENSIHYEHGIFVVELNRVIIHGLLHLIGYDDKSDKEIKLMRQKEDFYLNYL